MNVRCSHVVRFAAILILIALFIIPVEKPGHAQEQEPGNIPPVTSPAAQPPQPGNAPQNMPEQPAPVAPVAPFIPSHNAAANRNDVSFNFDDADVYEVIQTVFGDILKANYMVDARVKGRVNFRTAKPVPKDEVLPLMSMLLKLDGAGYVEEKGLYKILPLADIPGTAPRVFVYPLQNAKAKHVATLLQSIFTGVGQPAAPGRFIPEAPAGSAPQQPAQSPAVSPRTGAAGSAPGSGTFVSPETKVFADEITNSLVILATSDDYRFIDETIKKLDTAPRQVMIEVLIAEVTLTKDFQFGLEWVISNSTSIHPFSRTVNINGPLGVNTNILSTTNLANGLPGFSYAATDIAGNVKALLNTLASDNKVTVLASPHILAADNMEAHIQIGDEVPIATSQLSAVATGTTNNILSTIQYKDVGTILKVKPQINESGVVAMEVSQEVSDYSTQTVLGTTQYVFTKREASTNLVAQDGQTIVIGGLIENDRTKTMTGVPFLSNIPILGHLFSSTDDTTTRTEIIVLLTPHVIRNRDEAGAVTSNYLNRLKDSNKETNLNNFIKNGGQKDSHD